MCRRIKMTDLIFSFFMILFIAPALTCLIEVPIIKKLKVTADTEYIIQINILTNLFLNCGAVLINNTLGYTGYLIYNIIFEALIIPVSEALLYSLISDLKLTRILYISYLANMISCTAGIIITFLKEILL